MSTKKGVKISVDARGVKGKLDHVWRYIGYDECNYTHTPEGEELISKFGSLEDGPYYIRTHHIFCTGNMHGTYKWGSTNAYTEDANGNPIYYWETIDKILDVFLRNNCKPFVELGFMPMDLVDMSSWTDINEWNLYENYKRRGWNSPPKDYNKWYDLVFNFAAHCVERYGQEEVLTWYWELWNEPDIFYWNGTIEEFFRLYDYTEAALHAVLKGARFGGPATTSPAPGSMSLDFLEKFLVHCSNGENYFTKETGTRLDYVTFHAKGGGFPFNLNAPKATPSTKSLISQVKTGLEALKKHGFGDREVVLSEADPDGWAAGGRFENANMNFRNTEYYASYVASAYHNINRLSKAMGMDVKPLAWAFMFIGERCFEGTRTFSTQGINKPIFNLFKLYAKMGSKALHFESSGEKDILSYNDNFGTGEEPEVSGMASVSPDEAIQVMVYSHHDDWAIEKDFQVKLQIENWRLGEKIEIKHYRIDKTHSNAYTEWLNQGKPDYPTKEQYGAIKSRDGLELYEKFITAELKDYAVTLEFNLSSHAVSFIEISKA
ncbi:MAG: hypothetical protein Q8930_15955 [Bacillota bacterium]|nr:hypothetical protein [Bacillota bacterium]